MAYTEDERNERLSKIFELISNGKSLRKVLLEVKMSSTTFFEWIDGDAEKTKQYARACEEREELIFEEIFEISDHNDEDHTPFTGGNVIQRDRLKIDARKWALSKMNPKKYGDKQTIDHQTKGESINLISLGNGINPNETTD